MIVVAPALEDVLRTSTIFRRVGPDDRQRLASVAHLKHYVRGDLIFREDDPSDAFYTVIAGRGEASARATVAVSTASEQTVQIVLKR